jgi:hypothetical protein
MQAQEILKKAMSNRKSISFQYYKIGKTNAEKVGNAHVILISTDGSGKETVMLELSQNVDTAKSKFRNAFPSWRYFDMNDMVDIEILNNE